ncbi:MAG: hypothetical protein ABL921_00465 [Pirellula sp.]
MSDAVPVTAIALDLDDQEGEFDPFTVSTLWVEAVTSLLCIVGLVLGFGFIRDWFTTADRFLAVIFISLGLVFALAQANWRGFPSQRRLVFAVVIWSICALLMLLSFVIGGGTSQRLPILAAGLALSGWCAIRIRGESVHLALSLGLAVGAIAVLDEIGSWGIYGWLESCAVAMVGGLADVTGLSNIREENSNLILFEHGVGDRFFCTGTWDSLISLVGIGLFCCIARRRNLLSFLSTSVSVVLVWQSVRSIAWVILLHLGVRDGSWFEWATWIEIVCLLLGGLLVFSLDAFMSAILQPIPFEFVNLDFPLFALGWNWLCGLPKLTLTVPQRETDFGPMEEATEEEFA